jgi:hypothetical protein
VVCLISYRAIVKSMYGMEVMGQYLLEGLGHGSSCAAGIPTPDRTTRLARPGP